MGVQILQYPLALPRQHRGKRLPALKGDHPRRAVIASLGAFPRILEREEIIPKRSADLNLHVLRHIAPPPTQFSAAAPGGRADMRSV